MLKLKQRSVAGYQVVEINADSAIFLIQGQRHTVKLGASIGSCCYEVGGEVYDETKKLGLEDSISKKEKSFYLDIGSILKKQLLTCGIKKENIEFSDECTKCKNDKYFSYRAEPSTGRFAGVIKLN
jgi:copper oxidase (laccase) domain-containing protein